MGTSSSNRGPKSKSDLLPSWYNDLLDDVTADGANLPAIPNEVQPEASPDTDPHPNQTDNWRNAKGGLTRAAGGTATGRIKKAAKSYVKAHGGARKAAKAAKRGVVASRGLFSFFGSASAKGFNRALEEIGLGDCIGQPPEIVLARLADKLAPVGDTSDDAIARDAMISTLDELYTKAAEDGDDTALEHLTETTMRDVVLTYVSNFIFIKWLHELGIAIEKSLISEAEAIKLEKDIKEFVREEVRVSMSTIPAEQLDPSDANNHQLIQNIFQIAYSALEL